MDNVVDEINSDVFIPSGIVEGEYDEVPFVDNVVSSVEPLSNIVESNVDVVIEDKAVVNAV